MSAAVNVAPLFGLVVAGGLSERMQRDKAALQLHAMPQLDHAFELLQPLCAQTYVAVRAEQRDEAQRARYPLIVDTHREIGPIAGITAAQAAHPQAAWLVLACDLPLMTDAALRALIAERDPQATATAYARDRDGWPEPLCAIWEPRSAPLVLEYIRQQRRGPRKLLKEIAPKLIYPSDPGLLTNMNTPADYQNAANLMNAAPIDIDVQYFALFRERAGKRSERLSTTARTADALYAELQTRYDFTLKPEQLKVAINNEFRDWQSALQSGDHVAFIPPVAGG